MVLLATQITNDVPFSLAYYRDTRHYPSRHSDLTKGGQPMLPIPKPKDPGSRGDKFEQVDADDLADDGNKVGEFC